MTFVHQVIPGTKASGLQALSKYLNPRGSAYAAWLFGSALGTPGADLTGNSRNAALSGGTQGANAYTLGAGVAAETTVVGGVAGIINSELTLWAIYKANTGHNNSIIGNYRGDTLNCLLINQTQTGELVAYNNGNSQYTGTLAADPEVGSRWALAILSCTPTTTKLYRCRTGLRQSYSGTRATGYFGGDRPVVLGVQNNGANMTNSDPSIFAAGICTRVFTDDECDRAFRMMREVMSSVGEVL